MGSCNKVSHNDLLLLEIRCRNHSHISQEKKFVVVRILDYAHMGEGSLRRKEPGFLVENCPDELIRRAESLHQKVSLSLTDHADRLGYRLVFLRNVDYPEFVHVNAFLSAYLFNQCPVSDQCDINNSKRNSLGGCCNGMRINSPGCNHAFLRPFRCKGRKNI